MEEEKKEKSYAETPLMKQYNQIKAKHPTALLLFRVGDFYETFGEDAIKTSRILGIVLTRRANGKAAYVELAGFPHHSLETYLPKLVRAGEKVAICDQLEDPKMTKTIVKRGVTELVTPGIAYNDRVLEHKENNYLAALHIDSGKAGVAFLDVSTGEFFMAQGSVEYVEKLVQSFIPSEIVLRRDLRNKVKEQFGSKFYLSTFDDWVFTYDFGYELLTNHFGTKSLKGFGVEKLEDGIIAAGAVLHYLSETHHDKVQHINKIARIDEDNHVWLDQFTIRNLELLFSTSSTGMSLLDVIDKTNCPMGSRLLKRWMVLPLKDKIRIEERLDVVGFFVKNTTESEHLAQIIRHIGDMERLISKVSIAKVNPKEVLQLKRSLTAIPKIQEICLKTNIDPILHLAQNMNPCSDIADRIEKTLQEDAPLQLNKGNVIKEGISDELDELRSLAFSGKDYVQKIREREIIRTGIPSLKIGYNNVFGYYLEVTNVHKDKVPEDWIRKQTLANNERYITPELKEYEDKILGAEEKILELESRLFDELVTAIAGYIQTIQNNGQLIAQLDVLLSFAQISRENLYSRPKINDGFSLDIKDGRHPVIEKNLSHDENYVTNDVYLDNNKQQIIILTGPNMSGKSALLRQTALIVLMAQMGCFVPATKAEIGIIDKIFTRVGASDNISSGESTFMVEMNETASILNNISNRSLILLDEIGRGTSTYDGISIAWAISEYLHEHPAYKAKILFATHYHELNEMASSFKRIKNFHIHVKEINNKIIFLRKMVAGGSEHSFGIHVARMAGMPKAVLNRSTEILHQLEKSHSNAELTNKVKSMAEQKKIQDQYQLSFIQLDDPLLVQIKEDILNTDINTLTPVEALMKLNEIKKLITKK